MKTKKKPQTPPAEQRREIRRGGAKRQLFGRVGRESIRFYFIDNLHHRDHPPATQHYEYEERCRELRKNDHIKSDCNCSALPSSPQSAVLNEFRSQMLPLVPAIFQTGSLSIVPFSFEAKPALLLHSQQQRPRCLATQQQPLSSKGQPYFHARAQLLVQANQTRTPPLIYCCC